MFRGSRGLGLSSLGFRVLGLRIHRTGSQVVSLLQEHLSGISINSHAQFLAKLGKFSLQRFKN